VSLDGVFQQSSLNRIILNDENLRADLGVIMYGHWCLTSCET
jgi:hypothetical protein